MCVEITKYVPKINVVIIDVIKISMVSIEIKM